MKLVLPNSVSICCLWASCPGNIAIRNCVCTISSPTTSLAPAPQTANQLLRVQEQFISTLFWQNVYCASDSSRCQDQQAPADGAKYPRRVKPPSREETLIVIVEICLWERVSNFLRLHANIGKRTMIAMPAHCTTAERVSSAHTIFQP